MQLASPSLCRPRAWAAGLAAAILGGIVIAGCFTGVEGLSPPLDAFYYPTGLAVSTGRCALYVANSDFDLQYNGGTVQVVDLPKLREKAFALEDALNCRPEALPECTEEEALLGGQGAAEACQAAGLAVNDNRLLNPGPCMALPAAGYIRSSVILGAFASGAILVHRQDGGSGESTARLFVPVRGDPSVTFFDVADDRENEACAGEPFTLRCGAGDDARCTDAYRIGEDASESVRELQLPLEPEGIAADDQGEAIVTAHQSENATSLIINRWTEKPTLEYSLTGLSEGPTEVVSLPVPAIVRAQSLDYLPGFLVTFRASPELDLLRYVDDAQASPERPFLTRAAVLGIGINSSGFDSRGAAIDPTARRVCEHACDPADLECLADCASVPIPLYVANRSPASLLIGEVRTELVELDGVRTGAYETLALHDTFPLAYGASKVAVGYVIGEDGAPHLRVFAVAFDSRLIFSYDPEARRIDAVIHTGRGPHAIAFDTGVDPVHGPYSFLYVGHFTDSYIGVVDLDMRKPSTFGSMFLSMGEPTPPRESQ